MQGQTESTVNQPSIRNNVDRFLRNWSESVEADSNINGSVSSGVHCKDSPRAVLQKRGEAHQFVNGTRLFSKKIDNQDQAMSPGRLQLKLNAKRRVF